MLTTSMSYRLIANDIDRSLETTAKQPMVARETAYYLENIGNVKSIKDFLADDRLFKYAMKAHGLGDMDYAKAFVRKALTEGIDDDRSFANRLSDKRYRDFVETFNFARYGEDAMVFQSTKQGTVDKYMRQTLEENAGAQNEGVRLALYFTRKAPSVKNAYEILADPALQKVVYTILGMPSSMAGADIDKQADAIVKRIKIEDFSDPEKLQKLVQRFTTMWEVSEGPTMSQPTNALLIGQQSRAGLTLSLLTSLQKFRIGGR